MIIPKKIIIFICVINIIIGFAIGNYFSKGEIFLRSIQTKAHGFKNREQESLMFYEIKTSVIYIFNSGNMITEEFSEHFENTGGRF